MKYIITERQNKILVESIPVKMRRRFTYDRLKGSVDSAIKDVRLKTHTCDMSIDDYIHRISNMVVGDIFYTYEDESGDNDIHEYANEFRTYIAGMFDEYLRERYNRICE